MEKYRCSICKKDYLPNEIITSGDVEIKSVSVAGLSVGRDFLCPECRNRLEKIKD